MQHLTQNDIKLVYVCEMDEYIVNDICFSDEAFVYNNWIVREGNVCYWDIEKTNLHHEKPLDGE